MLSKSVSSPMRKPGATPNSSVRTYNNNLELYQRSQSLILDSETSPVAIRKDPVEEKEHEKSKFAQRSTEPAKEAMSNTQGSFVDRISEKFISKKPTYQEKYEMPSKALDLLPNDLELDTRTQRKQNVSDELTDDTTVNGIPWSKLRSKLKKKNFDQQKFWESLSLEQRQTLNKLCEKQTK